MAVRFTVPHGMLATVCVETVPPGVVTVSVPEKNAPAGQSRSEELLPGNTSATPKVAVTVPPVGMPELEELQLRLGLIGCAVTRGSMANNPNDTSASRGTTFVTCISDSEFARDFISYKYVEAN